MSKKKKTVSKKTSKQGSSTSDSAEIFHAIKSEVTSQLNSEELRAKLKQMSEEICWQELEPKRLEDATDAEQIAYGKENAELDRQEKEERKWEAVYNVARQLVKICMKTKRDEPESKLFQRAEELAIIVERLDTCRKEVSKAELARFRVLLDTCSILFAAEVKKQGTKSENNRGGDTKKPEKKHKPWPNPPDNTCFIVFCDDIANKLLFCHKGVCKNLGIDNKAHALPLLEILSAGLNNQEIQKSLNTKTKASKIVARTNDILNRQIAKKGFQKVPRGVEFIGKHDGGNYVSHLDVHVLNSQTDLRLKLEELGVDQENVAP